MHALIGLAYLVHCTADSCDKSVSVTSGHGGITRTELGKHLYIQQINCILFFPFFSLHLLVFIIGNSAKNH